MGYPTIETIKMFVEITNRDGFEEISENLLLKHKDQRIMPLLSYFKQAIIQMLEGELYDEADGFSSGFIVCLDLFRRQIESEAITLEELEIQLENILAWAEYLEKENVNLKNQIEELSKRHAI
jgi:hypothetical protein